MKKINWEYDIPKLRNIITVVIIIFGILMIAFHWTTADFIFKIMIGLTCALDAVLAWMEKKRITAGFWGVLAICWFFMAVNSFFRYNM